MLRTVSTSVPSAVKLGTWPVGILLTSASLPMACSMCFTYSSCLGGGMIPSSSHKMYVEGITLYAADVRGLSKLFNDCFGAASAHALALSSCQSLYMRWPVAVGLQSCMNPSCASRFLAPCGWVEGRDSHHTLSMRTIASGGMPWSSTKDLPTGRTMAAR